MGSHRSSLRRSTATVTTALAGLLVLTGCGGSEPADEQATAPPTSTAETTGPPPEATTTTTDSTNAGYTVEQVRSAVALVSTPDSSLRITAGDSPQVTDPFTQQMFRMQINGAVVEPAECEQHYKDGIQFMLDHLQHPFVFATGDEDRLLVRATVFPTAQEATQIAASAAPPQDDACRGYTIRAEESGEQYRRTHTPFEVVLPESATEVSAATIDVVSWGGGIDYTGRHSEVNAVVENVWVTVEYGAPLSPADSADAEAVPLQGERSAAELAAQQVLTELTESS